MCEYVIVCLYTEGSFMRPGANGELILEGGTEARVAAHYLQKGVGRPALAHFEPPISNPHIGRYDFISSRIEDKIGTGDKTEHVVRNPDAAILIAQMISVEAVPESLISFIPKALNRRGFLGKRVREYWEKQQEQKAPTQ